MLDFNKDVAAFLRRRRYKLGIVMLRAIGKFPFENQAVKMIWGFLGISQSLKKSWPIDKMFFKNHGNASLIETCSTNCALRQAV